MDAEIRERLLRLRFLPTRAELSDTGGGRSVWTPASLTCRPCANPRRAAARQPFGARWRSIWTPAF